MVWFTKSHLHSNCIFVALLVNGPDPTRPISTLPTDRHEPCSTLKSLFPLTFPENGAYKQVTVKFGEASHLLQEVVDLTQQSHSLRVLHVRQPVDLFVQFSLVIIFRFSHSPFKLHPSHRNNHLQKLLVALKCTRGRDELHFTLRRNSFIPSFASNRQ